MKPTLAKLNELLQDEDLPVGGVVNPITKNHCETYGRKTFAYFVCRNMIQRRRIEEMLTNHGATVNPRYCTVRGGCSVDSPMVEVQVSYLRAKGWNE